MDGYLINIVEAHFPYNIIHEDSNNISDTEKCPIPENWAFKIIKCYNGLKAFGSWCWGGIVSNRCIYCLIRHIKSTKENGKSILAETISGASRRGLASSWHILILYSQLSLWSISNKLTQISAPMRRMMIHSRKSDFWFCMSSSRYLTFSETRWSCRGKFTSVLKQASWYVCCPLH